MFEDDENTHKLQFFDWAYNSDMGSGDDFPLAYTQYFSADAGITYRTPMGKDVDGEQNITIEGQAVAFAGGVQYASFDSDYLTVYAELNLFPIWWNLLDHTVIWDYYGEDLICMTTASDLLIGWVNMNIAIEVYECNWSLFDVSYYGHRTAKTCWWSGYSFDDLIDYTLKEIAPTLFSTCQDETDAEVTEDVTEEVPEVIEESTIE